MENEYNINNIKVIIGLGNIGSRYFKTRHNIGFLTLDYLASMFGLDWIIKNEMEGCLIPYGIERVGHVISLVKPQTFMNNSGQILSHFLKKGIKSEEFLVVHDELEKDFGKFGIKLGGSARGHNGLRSIINIIGKDFWRLWLGIGRPRDSSVQVSDYVLSNFTSDEQFKLEEIINLATDMIINKNRVF
jgi:peptidyl-tRNA hydrolase, PTH1 family